MRYWYNSDNLSWTSNDGFEIWLDSDIYGYRLFSPDGFCLGVWFCEDLRKQIECLDIKLYEYMFYKAERFLTVIGIKINEALDTALNKAVCTRNYWKVEDDPLRNQKLRINYTPNKEVDYDQPDNKGS